MDIAIEIANNKRMKSDFILPSVIGMIMTIKSTISFLLILTIQLLLGITDRQFKVHEHKLQEIITQFLER